MPRSHLFEVDGINPPRKISKLSLRYRCSIATLRKDNMPWSITRSPSGRATVGQNHPAAVAVATAAAAAAAARVEAVAGKFSAPTSRDSPSRDAKTLANEKISEIYHHNPRAAVAVLEAPDDAQATAGVTVDFRSCHRRHCGFPRCRTCQDPSCCGTPPTPVERVVVWSMYRPTFRW